jgi:putative endonuclease
MTSAPGDQGSAGRRAAYKRGRNAEWRAALLLRAKGYRIVARGYRCRAGEIDIVARRGTVLVAVEVKTRADLTAAAEAINPHQRMRIARAMSDFTARNRNFAGCDIRFDAILMAPRRWPHHIVDAWRPADGERM